MRVRQLFAAPTTSSGSAWSPTWRPRASSCSPGTTWTSEERDYLLENYALQLGAVLTPLAADPSHPFPHIRNLRPALAVIVRVPETGAEHFAAIELPGDLPRFVPLPGRPPLRPAGGGDRAPASPRSTAASRWWTRTLFRVTRSANLSMDEEGISDLLQAVEEKVQPRPLGPVVRLEVQARHARGACASCLLRELQFEAARPRRHPARGGRLPRRPPGGPLRAARDRRAAVRRAPLPAPAARAAPSTADRSVWESLRERERPRPLPLRLLRGTVERLLAEAAARRPRCVSIKITLYRTNRSSRVVTAPAQAPAGRARRSSALVELKASFDEKRNIEWARALESAGIHVVYGPAAPEGARQGDARAAARGARALRRYLYIGTGNLNAATAAGYTDLGLLSTDPELGEELSDVFNGLTGYSVRTEYEHLLVAPFNMRERFLAAHRARDGARAGGSGRAAAREDQRPHRPRADRRALPRLAAPGCGWRWWCAGSAASAPACPASRRTSGCQHPGPLPRARAHLPLRQRRRARVLHRLRRLAPPQPQPARGGGRTRCLQPRHRDAPRRDPPQPTCQPRRAGSSARTAPTAAAPPPGHAAHRRASVPAHSPEPEAP